MKTPNIEHRFGGQIEEITCIEHSTYRRIPTWNFRGRVKWNDGGESPDTEIGPTQLCGAAEDVNPIFAMLSDYLREAGTWLEEQRMIRGCLISWMPHKPAGRRAI